MRRILGVLFAVLAWWGALGLGAGTPLPPPPGRWVTDGPALLSPATRQDLDRRLAAYEKDTGHQVLVWIGGSTGEIPLEDWAVRTFEAWKVGRKGIDDGLVLFILAQDHRLRIEVGYGLEGRMPDALASRIIRETLAPRLGRGDWDGAVSEGVDRILDTLGGGARPPVRRSAPVPVVQLVFFAILGVGFLFLLATHPSLAIGLLFSLMSGGRGGGRGGGGWSGGGGGWSGGGGRSGGGGASGSW